MVETSDCGAGDRLGGTWAGRGFSRRAVEYSFSRLWGYIDAQGATVIQPQYNDCSRFSEGLANVEKDDLEGDIDVQDGITLPCQYKCVELLP